MRTIGFIIAFSFALAGPTLSGTASFETGKGGLPGIGTFSYGGSPIAKAAPSTKFACLTLTRRG